ncbi:hypothetical protein KEM56_001817 [Ascosphaera pollenicola]|nr:hypothetical protein KEM56_001817 [Ascosphaera pollenicola]
MADRFPSLDEIDQGQTDVKPDTVAPAANLDAEDASDFLARERAALGDDADLFAAPQSAAAPHVGDDDDLLGGADEDYDGGNGNGVSTSSAAHTVPIMNSDTFLVGSGFVATCKCFVWG